MSGPSVPKPAADTLRLAPFEHYMLADDRPDYPMQFYVRAELDGPLHRTPFEAALAEAIGRHPLLRATVQGSVRGRTAGLVWRPHPEARCFLSWDRGHMPLSHPHGSHVDLWREYGMRVWVRERGAGAAELVLQLHHSCTDGMGAIGFLDDLLTTYRRLAPAPWPGRDEPAPPVDGESATSGLDRRSDFARGAFFWLRRIGSDLRSTVAFARSSPAPLPPTRGPALRADGEALPRWPRVRLDPEEVEALRRGAKRAGCTVNDLLLRDLFLTLDAWCASRGDGPRRRTIRITMATNLREPGRAFLSAMNRVGLAFLDRRAPGTRDPAALLEGIRRETGRIKKDRTGLALIRCARLLGGLPGGISRLLRQPACFSTAVLSNLGEVFSDSPLVGPDPGGGEAGGPIRLTSVELLPPVRPKTGAAFGVATLAGRMTISLNYDTNLMTAADAEELLNRYGRRIRATAGIPGPREGREHRGPPAVRKVG